VALHSRTLLGRHVESGIQTVYRLFNAQDDIVCERISCRRSRSGRAPGEQDSARDARIQTPVNSSTSCIFVSFEWDYVNVLTSSGSPVCALCGERSERHPLVVIGGA
jgi:hypothetical protein